MERETGGPAFPVPMFSIGHAKYEAQQQGLTLRDYFAAKAMQAEMSLGIHESDFDRMAALCYKAADSMLKARLI
jgi:hypothetical protein